MEMLTGAAAYMWRCLQVALLTGGVAAGGLAYRWRYFLVAMIRCRCFQVAILIGDDVYRWRCLQVAVLTRDDASS